MQIDSEECQNAHACEAAGLEGCQNGEVDNVSVTMNDLIRKESFFEQGSANGIFDERANKISWWPEGESVNGLGIGNVSEKRNTCEVVSGMGGAAMTVPGYRWGA